MIDFHFIAGVAAGSAWDGALWEQECGLLVIISLAGLRALLWEPLFLRPLEVASSIPFPVAVFSLAGKPCLTRELSQAVDYELVGGGQVTAWHPQAFGEWHGVPALRGCGGHCVLQHRVPGCLRVVSLCCLQNVNVSLPGSFV